MDSVQWPMGSGQWTVAVGRWLWSQWSQRRRRLSHSLRLQPAVRGAELADGGSRRRRSRLSNASLRRRCRLSLFLLCPPLRCAPTVPSHSHPQRSRSRPTAAARSLPLPLLLLLLLLSWSNFSPLCSAACESIFAGDCSRFEFESERCSAPCAVQYAPSAADVRAECNVNWTDSVKYFCDIFASYDSRVVCPLVPKEWPTFAGDCDYQFFHSGRCSFCSADAIACGLNWFDADTGVAGSRWCRWATNWVCPVWRRPP